MTKADIIQAAFRAWGRTLYQHTSLTELAQDLGVTKPALYRHYHNKQALLDGMYEEFFDDYARSLNPGYEAALRTGDPVERILIMAESIVRYYGRNKDAFLFSLFQLYEDGESPGLGAYLRKRGIDMKGLLPFTYHADYPSLLQLIIATATFWLGLFHKCDYPPEEVPSEESIHRLIVSIREKITGGLGFKKGLTQTLDFYGLERQVMETAVQPRENDGLLKAVAEVVAEAGPWNASMNMVARRAGLSKSGLYAHFKNKQDMLAQLFLTEFEGIVAYAELNKQKSAAPLEKSYLAIIAIAEYLRAKPEILVALNWIRIRRLDLGISPPLGFYRIFSNTDGKIQDINHHGVDLESERNSQWILFLIVNILMHHPGGGGIELSDISNSSFRILFRFVMSGMRGFFVEGGAADEKIAL